MDQEHDYQHIITRCAFLDDELAKLRQIVLERLVHVNQRVVEAKGLILNKGYKPVDWRVAALPEYIVIEYAWKGDMDSIFSVTIPVSAVRNDEGLEAYLDEVREETRREEEATRIMETIHNVRSERREKEQLRKLAKKYGYTMVRKE